VYTSTPRVADARARLGPVATIVDGGRRVRMRRLSEDLADRGVQRLMVEGGGVVHTQFLADDLVDELQLVVAPFFVGDSSAPRFVSDGRFPWNVGRRATLAEVRQIGDGVRGLAALYVVIDHVFLRAFPGYPVDRAPFWAGWFIYGRFAVVVFIVLSGFSLALSPARHGWRLGGASRFAYRRARRILPAYWAALA